MSLSFFGPIIRVSPQQVPQLLKATGRNLRGFSVVEQFYGRPAQQSISVRLSGADHGPEEACETSATPASALEPLYSGPEYIRPALNPPRKTPVEVNNFDEGGRRGPGRD